MSAKHQEDAWAFLERVGSYVAGELEREDAPSEIIGYALRRAYVSAFLRQGQQLAHGLVGDYLGALAFYLGLSPVRLR